MQCRERGFVLQWTFMYQGSLTKVEMQLVQTQSQLLCVLPQSPNFALLKKKTSKGMQISHDD